MNTGTYTGMPENKGFSVVELLVAMTIGLILISGMIAVFSGNKRSADLNSAMTNMQESARFSIDAIARDARLAGFQGCIDINTSAALIRASNAPSANLYETASTGSLVVSATEWNPPPPPTFQMPTGDITPVLGTHTLLLQFGSSSTVGLSTPMPTPAAPVTVAATDNVWNLNGDELMMISNCEYADVFRISGLSTDGMNLQLEHNAANNLSNGNLTSRYGDESGDTARLMLFNSNVYFVGNTGLTNDFGDPIRALYRQALPYSEPPLELIQGVENMRVRFGVRQNDGSLRYFLPTSTDFSPDKVESIQIGLLISSWEHAATVVDEQTYVLAGQQIGPSTDIVGANASGLSHAADRRLRLAFNTTIKVRNRRTVE